ncbi:hypothetical protein EAS61_09160 [Bradyrhizobium zhanjiangense]|uniref:Uncharacterized protein n=1 Tax=Bradyrhizobium zhanjiangense TaxID=1325107 RepID=A0A4Q0QU08_9BRAD|nr:hypothetical protein EAS62_21650 [Bradyrhizobium zhanjiangense]RXH00547.1 hypothetical protein EAS61_09160 [Bradyrhizobium zhanjiangense]
MKQPGHQPGRVASLLFWGTGSTYPSLRAKRSNPEYLRGDSLDCFVARAPRNDGCGRHIG